MQFICKTGVISYSEPRVRIGEESTANPSYKWKTGSGGEVIWPRLHRDSATEPETEQTSASHPHKACAEHVLSLGGADVTVAWCL